FLILAGAAFAAAPVVAHTPYGQWVVYRRKHLLIGAHRGDAATYARAKDVVAGLDRELPEARARVARGPRPQRIASLMTTGQLSLAVLADEEAGRMARAEPPFESYRPTPLRALAALGGGYFLFASPDFPARHARMVTEALDHGGLAAPPEATALEVHEGAASYWRAGGG
ncbi:MAG: hypothetical protein AAGF90_01835, partial [Pseudomonadota bacterium]